MPLREIQQRYSTMPTIHYQMRPKAKLPPLCQRNEGSDVNHYSHPVHRMGGNDAADPVPILTDRMCGGIDVIVDVHTAPRPRPSTK